MARGSPARPSNRRVTAGGTRPETTGAPQRRATATSQAAGNARHVNSSTRNKGQGAHRQIIERCCSRIAINTQRANDLRIAVSHTLPPYSQRFVQNGRAHSSPDSLSLKKNTQSHETRAALLHQHSQGRPHAAVAAADARRCRRGATTAFARHFKPRCPRERGQNSNLNARLRRRRAQHTQQPRTAARAAKPPQRT